MLQLRKAGARRSCKCWSPHISSFRTVCKTFATSIEAKRVKQPATEARTTVLLLSLTLLYIESELPSVAQMATVTTAPT